jgi:hypothetical protein
VSKLLKEASQTVLYQMLYCLNMETLCALDFPGWLLPNLEGHLLLPLLGASFLTLN